MAIDADISVAVNGDIRYTGTTSNYTVLEFHTFMAQLGDNATSTGDDIHDATSDVATNRSFDTIITVNAPYNIDDVLAQHLYGGSITQSGGATVYSGLQIKGSVNAAATQLEVVQDNALLTSFWGTQASGGLNGDAANGVLARFLVKTRTAGADIDGKRVRVQARHWGDTYAFFNITLGVGEETAAIETLPDGQNDTLQATVTAYTHVTNTEGFQTIDLNNGNGAQPYYSQWTYGANTSGDGLKGLWEFGKDLTGNGTAKTIHGLNGELFLGPTHSWGYDTEAGGPFVEDEILAWGTEIAYDTEAGGPFTLGEYVTIGANGAAGKLVHLIDAGLTGTIKVALEDTTITLLDGDVITGLTSGATASINLTITDNGLSGGTGVLLALDDQGLTGNMYVQLLSGSAPVDNLEISGQTSNATCLVNLAPVVRAVPKVFLGAYTGAIQGGYGLGVTAGDLVAADQITDLLNVNQAPPDNRVTSVTSTIIGQDYVLVGPNNAGALDKTQLTVLTALVGATETAIVCNAAIPGNTPAAGTLRVITDAGVNRLVNYTSWTGSTFTIPSTSFTADNVSALNNAYVTYIYKLATSTAESFTSVYTGPATFFASVKNGVAPNKPFLSTVSHGNSVGAVHTLDA